MGSTITSLLDNLSPNSEVVIYTEFPAILLQRNILNKHPSNKNIKVISPIHFSYSFPQTSYLNHCEDLKADKINYIFVYGFDYFSSKECKEECIYSYDKYGHPLARLYKANDAVLDAMRVHCEIIV